MKKNKLFPSKFVLIEDFELELMKKHSKVAVVLVLDLDLYMDLTQRLPHKYMDLTQRLPHKYMDLTRRLPHKYVGLVTETIVVHMNACVGQPRFRAATTFVSAHQNHHPEPRRSPEDLRLRPADGGRLQPQP